MNLFGRARRSVLRKPVKSILLFLVVLIISIFLLSGMASKSASIKTQDNTKQAIGAGFVLEANAAYYKNLAMELSEQIGGEGTLAGFHQKKVVVNNEISWQSWTDNGFQSLDRDDIEKIAQSSGICDYNITTAITAVNPVNFTRIEEADVDQTSDMLGVSLIGNWDMKMDSNVLIGNLSIIEGRMAGREDKNVCVVSEELAQLNHLEIGDKLQFNDRHDRENSTVYEAEVIGIYQVKQMMTPLMSGDTFRSENVIFTDLRFPEKPQGCDGDPAYEKAYFKVEDVTAYDDVKKQVKHIDVNWEKYDFIDNNGNYDTMSSNFYELERISNILLWVVAAASFVILFLVFVFWQKSRVQEIGIFLSMGVPKIKIIGQILSEGLMIAVIAAIVSFVAAPKVSSLTADYLVGQQVRQEQEKKEMNAANVSYDGIQSEETVNGVSVHITPQMMAFDGMAIAILISLSVITSGILIVIKRPKDILSEMS
ncbi:MAG: ABC transporter permease [Lachnospiraceae bacterium]|nr:ABC transporter permease [Lachnospiraceae bacterium]